MILGFIIFILAVIFCFCLPGLFLLKKSSITITSWERLILGTSLGFVAFTLLSYILILVKLELLILLIVIFIDIFCLKNTNLSFKQYKIPDKKHLITLLLIFILGIAGQLAVIAPSGTTINGDIVFWSSNGHDGAWHIALMESISKGPPFMNPSLAGERLINYHFFSDIAPAVFYKYLGISGFDLYFKFFPLFYSILLGALTFFIGKKIGDNFSAGIWSVFFVYFSGSFGYIATWIKNKTIDGESIFWASQIQSSSGNPPQIASFIILITFLYLFYQFLAKKNLSLYLLCCMLAGTLIVFKVYAGVVVLGSLVIIGFWQLLREKQFSILAVASLSSLLSAVLYFPNTSQSASFLIYEPWWLIRTMVVSNSRLDWLDLELKRQTYFSENNWKRVFQIEITSFLIFIFGNLGAKFIGIVAFFDKLKFNYFSQLLLLISFSSLILPLIFLQKGVAGNIAQFLQYLILIFAILSGIAVSTLMQKLSSKVMYLLVSFFIIFISVPTQVALLYDFYSKPPLAKISSNEIQALNYLKLNSEKNSTIIAPPYNRYFISKFSIPPIWVWSDTSYISAMSDRNTFLSDNEQIDIMGYNFKQRQVVQEEVFKISDPLEFSKILAENKINYLYFPKLNPPAADLQKTKLTKEFENDEIQIWKVN
ncbi:MAG: hypothetical protein WCV81_01670 [Microgenomates group bacterium]|jgi:hypothetical protein